MPEFDPQYQHTKVPSPSEVNPTSSEKLVETLLAANEACVSRTKPLVAMLGRCRQQFTLYGESHKAKDTEEGNQKAATNFGLAADIDQVLKTFRERKDEKPENESTSEG